MELTATCPDVTLWRHDRHEAFVLDGVAVPGLSRDVYRHREEGAESDTFSCAVYMLNGMRILAVWGVVGGADCCRYHQLAEAPVQEGAPIMEFDTEQRILRINNLTFPL